MPRIPAVGDIVHYVSHGTPPRADGTQAYPATCRAAIVTEAHPENRNEGLAAVVGLAVLNPTGMFFNQGVEYHDGAETPGSSDCPNVQQHGNPFRYCSCGWMEASHVGGTWHWPARV